MIFIRKGLFRTFQVFGLYLIWSALTDIVMTFFALEFQSKYLSAFLIEMPLDATFQFCVLLELAWSVLRPLRHTFSPRKAILLLALLILLAGVGVWPLARALYRPGYSPQWHLLFQVEQTVSILRILVLLLFAGFSQMLAIGWRDRELQIATGLGLYSLASLGAAAGHFVSDVRSLVPRPGPIRQRYLHVFADLLGCVFYPSRARAAGIQPRDAERSLHFSQGCAGEPRHTARDARAEAVTA